MKFSIIPKDRDKLQKWKEGGSKSNQQLIPEEGEDLDDSVIQSTEALKKMESEGKGNVAMTSKESGEKELPLKFSKTQGRQYGLQPKFIRMRELHLLLFYLCRDFNGQKLDNGKLLAHGKWDSYQPLNNCQPLESGAVGNPWTIFIPW